MLGFREPALPLLICIPACNSGYHLMQKTWETFFMPALISSLKTNSRGENSQTKLHASCLPGFSAKPHFMLQGLDNDAEFRLPSRAGARPHMSPPAVHHRLTKANLACGAAQPLCAGAELLFGSFSV